MMHHQYSKIKIFLWALSLAFGLTLAGCLDKIQHEAGDEMAIPWPDDMNQVFNRIINNHKFKNSWSHQPLKKILDQIQQGGVRKQATINSNCIFSNHWTPLTFVICARSPLRPHVLDHLVGTFGNPTGLVNIADRDYQNLLLYLLRKGADPNLPNTHGSTPLGLAILLYGCYSCKSIIEPSAY